MAIAADVPQLWEAVVSELGERRQVPNATYRIQLNHTFTFNDARARVPYWHALGISHVYASPFFKARPQSMHGYDIIDHNTINPDIGTEDELHAFVDELHRHGMGLVLDTVPNHMGIGDTSNQYWMDVLENGPSSPYATFFDIDWQPLKQEMENQVLLPLLGAQYGEILERQELKISYDAGAFYLNYWEHRLPIAPRTYTMILDAVLEQLQPQDATLELLPPPDAIAEHVLELQSIITALRNLPARTETDPERIAERHREKEVIKRRLNALTESYPEAARAIAAVLEQFNGQPGDPRSFDRLDELVRSQAYRLAYWRVAAEEINYRRFFDINDLAAIRMEQPIVFDATHRLLMRLLAEGTVNGLRIDHPDGLWDPAGYFANLQRHYVLTVARQRFDGPDEEWPEVEQDIRARYDSALRDDPHSLLARPLYIVVEKILGHNEPLPETWAVDGTSGYEFLNLVNGLFVESANAKTFDTIYTNFIKERVVFNDLVLARKRQTMLIALVSEVNVLAHQLSRIAERNRYYRDFTVYNLTFALREVIACFPVYRTYIADGVVPASARPYVEEAIACAKRRATVTDPSIFDFIRDVLLLTYPGTADEEDRRMQQDWVQKFQQVTGPAMAKGLEDTSFYIYNRLISLNEVGGEPQHFGTSVAEFHKANAERQRRWPHTMLNTSTHDTKRSEDVRARIDVLSELPREWRSMLSRWSRANRKHKTRVDGRSAPARNEEYLLYQTLLGAWETDGDGGVVAHASAEFVARMQQYMQKALKEAKVNTSWINPNAAWDEATSTFVARILNPRGDNPFLAEFVPFAAKIARYGAWNALSQTVLKLTAPGVPDLYQGNELWDLSLVDPDNRRPVDYDRRAALVQHLSDINDSAAVRDMVTHYADGRIKLLVTVRTLRLRRDHAALFADGSYTPLQLDGTLADRAVAFARRHQDAEMIVVVPRLLTGVVDEHTAPLGDVWGDTRLLLPEAAPGTRYTQIFTGAALTIAAEHGMSLPLAQVFADAPVAVLWRES
jgi:(1->4)-alpha-D-glucan 1-alpha-D-glucosylmutase